MVNSTQNKNVGPMPECLVCSQPSTKRCSNCHEANYCSTDHQRQHWKHHKKVCLPYKIVESDVYGKHLIASRDLDEKFVILQEAPLTFAPYDHHDSSIFLDSESEPICLGCCVRMSTEPSRRCSKCHWPVCSSECEKLKHHADNECQIFAEGKIHFPPKKCGALYNSVFVLRLILQNQNSSQWKKIMDLHHHKKIRKNQRKYDREVEMVTENLLEFYGSEEKLQEKVSKEDLAEIMERVIMSSFHVSSREESQKEVCTRGVYLKAGLACYGCIPNSMWTLSSSPNFELTLRTSVPIKKGEIIQIAFSSQWIFEGTYQRQINIFDDNKFLCKCLRCVDPTECGSYLSAIKCTSCKRGYLLPKNPTDFNAEALWQCSNNSCTQTEEQEKIMSVLHYFEIDRDKAIAGIRFEQSNVNKNSSANANVNVSKALQKLEELYAQYCESRLHENHFIIRSLQNEYLQQAFKGLQDLSFSEIDRAIFHCEQLLKVSVVLCPGSNAHLAMLRNFLGQVMLRKKLKAAKEGQTLEIFGPQVSLIDFLTRLDTLQKFCLDYYYRDPGTFSATGGTSSIIKKLSDENAIVVRDIKSAMANLLK